jgi:Acyltransferase C-terminus
MHWRRFAVSSIPVSDPKAFDAWLHERWVEKDALLEYWQHHGHFPTGVDEDPPAYSTVAPEANGAPVNASSKTSKAGFHGQIICERAGPNHPLEFLQIFVSLFAVPPVWKFFKLLVWIIRFFTG